MKTKQLVLCGVCAAVICVLAPLSVPIGPIPVTLGTFALMLTAVLLGGKYGAVSTFVYLLLGAVGIPVFSGYRSGVGVLFGPTGGYLIGYIPMVFVIGTICFAYGKKTSSRAKKYAVTAGSMVLGTLLLYVFGTAWYCITTGTDAVAALSLCVVPFLLGDAVKIFALTFLCPSLEKAIDKIPEKQKKQNDAAESKKQ